MLLHASLNTDTWNSAFMSSFRNLLSLFHFIRIREVLVTGLGYPEGRSPEPHSQQ